MLSVATDYAADIGSPEATLRGIGRAGFSHVHWCHHWCTDFLYSKPEIEQIARWLTDFGLHVIDLHGSSGREKRWMSGAEYERLAGLELVRNRIEMTARLGGDAVIMHIGVEPADPAAAQAFWDLARRTLDEVEAAARGAGVRIALENGVPTNINSLRRVFELYAPDYVGLCYDSGHGNITGNGLDLLGEFKDRLIAIHLHDNDASADQHRLPGMGTVDWARLARIVAASAYHKPINLEVSQKNSGFDDEVRFLAAALEAASNLAAMVEAQT
jgi:sugar phosphate isomerase/epimerase